MLKCVAGGGRSKYSAFTSIREKVKISNVTKIWVGIRGKASVILIFGTIWRRDFNFTPCLPPRERTPVPIE